ncbi:MAG: hypothetical protein SFY66_19530 [Oculatellaceae cyanobacterium bins.114]|nr:hypothetical protein [Oculatellaceae cyanobacterium bins.114]
MIYYLAVGKTILVAYSQRQLSNLLERYPQAQIIQPVRKGDDR